jgi:hypothetical protein
MPRRRPHGHAVRDSDSCMTLECADRPLFLVFSRHLPTHLRLSRPAFNGDVNIHRR